MNLLDRILNAIRGPLQAEIAGITNPVQRSMHIDDIYRQLDNWAMMQMSSMYFACLYIEDSGELYGLFSQDGRLYRAPIAIDQNMATVGAMEEVQKVYEPVSRFFVKRQANGDIRFFMIAATAVVNRVGEIDSTMLFDNMIKRAEETGYYPKLDFYHLGNVHPAFEFGQFDVLARDGVAYVASGIMEANHPLTEAVLRSLPTQNYGASIEYYPIEGAVETLDIDGIQIRMYTDGINTRISLLPEQQAASWFTNIVTRSENNDMEKRQLEALRAAFGDEDELKKFLASIAGTNERAQGLIARATAEGDEAAADTEAGDDAEQPAAIEIDDETVKLIATEVVRQLGQTTLATVNGAIEKLTGDVGKLTSDVQALTGVQRKLGGRVDALEADDDTKRREWLGDLPQKRQTVTVTHRPRQERQHDDTPQTSDDVASATLAALPSPNKRNK